MSNKTTFLGVQTLVFKSEKSASSTQRQTAAENSRRLKGDLLVRPMTGKFVFTGEDMAELFKDVTKVAVIPMVDRNQLAIVDASQLVELPQLQTYTITSDSAFSNFSFGKDGNGVEVTLLDILAQMFGVEKETVVTYKTEKTVTVRDSAGNPVTNDPVKVYKRFSLSHAGSEDLTSYLAEATGTELSEAIVAEMFSFEEQLPNTPSKVNDKPKGRLAASAQ